MKIRCIVPNISSALGEGLVAHRQQAAGPGVAVDLVNIHRGPISLETTYEERQASPGILEQVEQAQQDGYDAVVIDCFGDPALRASRELADIPVIGPGETGMLFAMSLGDKFSILTVRNAVQYVAERVRSYGFGSRVASIRAVDISAFDLVRNEAAVQDAMYEEARRALDEDGADLVVLGCTGMSGAAQALTERLGVPVLDPAACAIKLARALVEMGLSPSRRAFPRPPVRRAETA